MKLAIDSFFEGKEMLFKALPGLKARRQAVISEHKAALEEVGRKLDELRKINVAISQVEALYEKGGER